MNKVVFVQAVDTTREARKVLSNTLGKITGYMFIVSDKEIRAIDKDELLKALK